ncbi:MAG TPA: hypothetical protein VGM37_10745 [Armatimonadota bacterium]
MHYSDGRTVELGDLVSDGGVIGTVVFVVEDEKFLPPYEGAEWRYLGKGLGILFGEDFLVVGDEPDLEWVLERRADSGIA